MPLPCLRMQVIDPFVEHEVDRQIITASMECFNISDMTECTGFPDACVYFLPPDGK